MESKLKLWKRFFKGKASLQRRFDILLKKIIDFRAETKYE